MMNVDHLKGFEFHYGRRDCYELMRDFFRDFCQIELRPYARPTEWWKHEGLNMYGQLLPKEGFRQIDYSPTEVRPGDVFLIAVDAQVANHAAIYVGSGHILHHWIGRRSTVDLYRGVWRNNTMAVWRHSRCPDLQKVEAVDLKDLLPPATRARIYEGTPPQLPG